MEGLLASRVLVIIYRDPAIFLGEHMMMPNA
jgi:hypothetical protein